METHPHAHDALGLLAAEPGQRGRIANDGDGPVNDVLLRRCILGARQRDHRAAGVLHIRACAVCLG